MALRTLTLFAGALAGLVLFAASEGKVRAEPQPALAEQASPKNAYAVPVRRAVHISR